MKDNLRNVAIPGTGIPLSVFCQSKATAMWFVSCLVPLACLLGAINKANKDCADTIRSREYCDRVADYFVQHLIHPDDWFSFWRLNCRLASWHSSVQGSCQYDLEDKWTFLRQGMVVRQAVTDCGVLNAVLCDISYYPEFAHF